MEKIENYTIESKHTCGILLKLLKHWLSEISKDRDKYLYLTLRDIIKRIIDIQEKIKYDIYSFYETSDGLNSPELIRDLKILLNQNNLYSHHSEFSVSINPSGILNASKIILPKIIEDGLY